MSADRKVFVVLEHTWNYIGADGQGHGNILAHGLLVAPGGEPSQGYEAYVVPEFDDNARDVQEKIIAKLAAVITENNGPLMLKFEFVGG